MPIEHMLVSWCIMHVVYITNKCMVDNLLPFVAAHQFINAVCILPYSVATSRKKTVQLLQPCFGHLKFHAYCVRDK